MNLLHKRVLKKRRAAAGSPACPGFPACPSLPPPRSACPCAGGAGGPPASKASAIERCQQAWALLPCLYIELVLCPPPPPPPRARAPVLVALVALLQAKHLRLRDTDKHGPCSYACPLSSPPPPPLFPHLLALVLMAPVALLQAKHLQLRDADKHWPCFYACAMTSRCPPPPPPSTTGACVGPMMLRVYQRMSSCQW